MSSLRIVLLAVAVSAVLAVGAANGRSPAAEAVTGVTLTPIASGLSMPTAMASAGDSRLFIVEQGGRIRIYDPGANPTLLAGDFLNVSGLISGAGGGSERGLLGLAFHPNYATNGRFFIAYTDLAGSVVLAQYTASGDPNVANASGAPLLTIPHADYNNHNGGQIAFGPDGKLYFGVGDGGGIGDPQNNAQNLNTLLGKILRIDVDAAAPYAIPANNPFVSNPNARDEIWAYGLRNPWKFTFDRATGDLFVADVGQELWEEINVQASTSNGGQNYGWRKMEGTHCFNPPTGCNSGGLTAPIIEYANASPDCSVTGGYRYRGSVSGFAGTYVYGDFCSGRIWGATKTTNVWTSVELIDSGIFISSFGQDSAGELYVADYFGGTIQRISILDSDGDGVPDASDNCPYVVNASQLNNDRNFIDQTPPKTVDDATRVMSDTAGDMCDTDDDNDGIADAQESGGSPCGSPIGATNPVVADTDGDLAIDGVECTFGSNPLDAGSKPPVPLAAQDPDGDTLTTTFENQIGSNPSAPDSDGDGLRDGVEYKSYGSRPTIQDSDADGVRDDCEATSLNMDTKTNPGDQALLASEIIRTPPPPKLANFDINKDGVLNPGDQAFQSSRALPGLC